MDLDFSFLEDSFVYKFLARKYGDLTSLKNVEFLMDHNNLEIFYDHPELQQQTIIDLFKFFEVIQDGKIVKSLKDFDIHSEALALRSCLDGHKDVFLVRASRD